MTLREIEECNKEFLIPADLKDVLGIDPYSINVQAKNDPSKLGFPVVVIGTRVKIPREGFLFFWKYGRPIKTMTVERDESA